MPNKRQRRERLHARLLAVQGTWQRDPDPSRPDRAAVARRAA